MVKTHVVTARLVFAQIVITGCLWGCGVRTPATSNSVRGSEPAREERVDIPNLQLPPEELRRKLEQVPFTITAAEDAGAGVAGARKLHLVFTDGFETDAKWKRTKDSGDSWNNSPRREIGAYEVQKFFLQPEAYIVPPSAPRCIPLEVYRPVDPEPQPNLPGTRCVFGLLSGWLSNVEQPAHSFDRARFESDPRYRDGFAALNLLHYLIDHRDARGSNFLISKNPADPRTYSIDNGIAFGGVLYNFFVPHYNRMVVSGLPKAIVSRLRAVGPRDLERLGVLGELRADESGVLRPVDPGPNLDQERGTRLSSGRIQFGLSAKEIGAIRKRLDDVIVRVDRGELTIF
jgi:hypothetical protein